MPAEELILPEAFRPTDSLDDEQARRVLGLASPRSLYWMRRKHTGPVYIKTGRLIRYRLKDLLAWQEANKVEPSEHRSAKPRRMISKKKKAS
jgi:hypothetical protein